MSVRSKRRFAVPFLLVPCLILLVALAFPVTARAQGAVGSISGTMIDSTNAVLPGVLVSCRNVRTGLTVEYTTNEVGIFRCPELPIGQYEVTGVLELREHLGAGYRVYFGRHGQAVVILLCGGSKKTQSSDIKTARQYWADWKRRQT